MPLGENSMNYDAPHDVPSDLRHQTRYIRHLALSAGILALACLNSCSYAPAQGAPGQILSRLPPGAPGAVPIAPQLTQSEKDRYKEIGQQVMKEQEEREHAIEQARIAAVTPIYYSGYPYYAPYPYTVYLAYQGYPNYPVYPSYPFYPPGYGFQFGW
jgi:hypothetical protein